MLQVDNIKNMENYSNEKAENEAFKMKGIVGDSGTNEDYTSAEELLLEERKTIEQKIARIKRDIERYEKIMDSYLNNRYQDSGSRRMVELQKEHISESNLELTKLLKKLE